VTRPSARAASREGSINSPLASREQKRALAGVAAGSRIAMLAANVLTWLQAVKRLSRSLNHLISAQLSNEGNMQESNHKRRLVFELSKVEKR